MRRLITLSIFIMVSFGGYSQAELRNVLDSAAANNAGLASQRAAIEASLSRQGRAGSWDDPRFSAGYFISPIETRTGPQRWRFSISQMLPWFGTEKAENELYEQLSDIEYLKWLDEREKLFLRLKGTYFRLWALKQLIDLNLRQDEILQNLEDLSETRISSGVGRLSEHNRILLSRKEIQNETDILRKEFQSTYRSFMAEVQSDIDTLSFDGMYSVTVSGQQIPDSLPLNPGYQILMARKEAALLEKNVIRQKGKPGIGAGLDYVIVDKRNDVIMPDNGKNALMPMVTLSLPIWRRKIKSATEEAEWKAEQYLSAAEQYEISLKAELEMTVFTMEKAVNSYSLAEEKLQLLGQTLELVETDFANDQANLYDLLLIQEDILEHEKRQVTALQNYLQADARFNYLTWQEAVQIEKPRQNEK